MPSVTKNVIAALQMLQPDIDWTRVYTTSEFTRFASNNPALLHYLHPRLVRQDVWVNALEQEPGLVDKIPFEKMSFNTLRTLAVRHTALVWDKLNPIQKAQHIIEVAKAKKSHLISVEDIPMSSSKGWSYLCTLDPRFLKVAPINTFDSDQWGWLLKNNPDMAFLYVIIHKHRKIEAEKIFGELPLC